MGRDKIASNRPSSRQIPQPFDTPHQAYSTILTPYVEHYSEHKDKAFFEGLIKYMMSGPVVAMVWQGKEVVKSARILLGPTNPLDAPPGTIRGDLAIDMGRNLCVSTFVTESVILRLIERWG